MDLIPASWYQYPPLEAEIAALIFANVVALAVCLLKLRSRPSRPGKVGVVRGLVAAMVLVASLEGALVVQECLAPSSSHRPGPNLTWTLPANVRDFPLKNPFGTTTVVSTNHLGLREVEVPLEKRPGEFRVLCVGDSWTFGQGVRREETWCKRLQALLRERHPHAFVTVVNAGMGGYSSLQGYYVLKQILPLYHPDLVILGGFNQMGNEQIPEMANALKLEEALPTHPLARRIMSALQKSLVYLLLRKEVYRWKPADVKPEQVAEKRKWQISDELSLRYTADAIAEARAAGARCIVFEHAFVVRTDQGASQSAYRLAAHSSLSRLTPSAGMLAVELCPVSTNSERSAYMQVNDWIHPSVKGHEAMARALCNLIEDHRLVGEGP